MKGPPKKKQHNRSLFPFAREFVVFLVNIASLSTSFYFSSAYSTPGCNPLPLPPYKHSRRIHTDITNKNHKKAPQHSTAQRVRASGTSARDARKITKVSVQVETKINTNSVVASVPMQDRFSPIPSSHWLYFLPAVWCCGVRSHSHEPALFWFTLLGFPSAKGPWLARSWDMFGGIGGSGDGRSLVRMRAPSKGTA